ncbi:uncharacterized protein LOC134527121 [Bacillus rossius redtenbacheri]|uniref:uncharacterized protein LOC134527121 n=1 Tax=Bacillus rossius redtenbacheri TaxID=93214 RepID=UPI002FDDE212
MKTHVKIPDHMLLHPHAAEDNVDGHGDAPQYYFLPESRIPVKHSSMVEPRRPDIHSSVAEPRRSDRHFSVAEPLRQYRHSSAIEPMRPGGLFSVAEPKRPDRHSSLIEPLIQYRHSSAAKSRRPEWHSKAQRRRHSKPLPLIDLSEDLDSFLSLYDDEAKHRGQDQARVPYASLQQFVPRHPARPRRRGFSAPLTVPTGIPLPRLPRKLARRSEIPLRRGRPVFLQAADQEMEESAPGAGGREGRCDYLKYSAEAAENEDSQQLAHSIASNVSVDEMMPLIPSRILKHSKRAIRRSNPALIAQWLPRPRRSKREPKSPRKSDVNRTESEVKHGLPKDLDKGDLAHDHILEQEGTQQQELVTDSEAGDLQSIGSFVDTIADQILSFGQEDKGSASRSSSYVQLDVRQLIDAMSSSSSTNLDPGLCMKLTRTLTDKLVTLDAPACQGCVIIPDEPKYITTLKQLQKVHLKHIQREIKGLLELYKYVEDHSHAFTLSSLFQE